MIDKQKELDSRERFEKWFVDGPGNRHVRSERLAFDVWQAALESYAVQEMYEALKGIMGHFTSGNCIPVERAVLLASSDAVQKARAALARVEGKP